VAALGANVLSSTANNNNEIGVPQTLLQLDETHRFAVIEMGMRGRGQIAELARIAQPTVGLITNVGPQHIEFFDDFQGVVA
ncbi:UDP-N-acetylmuramoyl-tripeptide--D-alanyl-D-alanine ligase, partial [Halomonas sp. ND22Bw]|uniref:Mur ligase family protein n=1 Tax=Halomonas sp. ND22Bw TaxID=2054178 RepID=UPI000D2EFC73